MSAAAGAQSAIVAPLAEADCPASGAQSARVAKIDAWLDIALVDGRSLHLAGLDPVQPTAFAPHLPAKAQSVLAAHLGGTVDFLPLAARPDRWGRIPAYVFIEATGGGAPERLGAWLLARGFARYMPTPEAHACRLIFRAAERQARAAKLGLWRDPYYAIIAAQNREAFADKGATNVIVEGQVTGIASSRFRSTLLFAPRREGAFSVTILQRNVAIFERSGLPIHALIGSQLRVRGLLDLRFGPQIELSNPDGLEVIANEPTRAEPRQTEPKLMNQRQGGKVGRSATSDAPPPTKNP